MRCQVPRSPADRTPAPPVFQAKADPAPRGPAPARPAIEAAMAGFSFADVPVHAPSAPAPSQAGLPPMLKAGVERLSGFAMDDVRVHRDSPEPAKLSALAFARGNDIHLGPGQERHLPHEAWHVAQQKQGRVQANAQMKGVGLSENAALEVEADRNGEAAMRIAAFGPVAGLKNTPVENNVVQRQPVLCEPDKETLPEGIVEATVALQPSDACTDLIKQFEGCAKKRADGDFDAYPDPGTGADPWTIGWGSTGTDVKQGVVWTQAQCDNRLAADVKTFSTQVSDAIGKAATSQNQFDAMVSFAYNLGAGSLKGSTLLKKHKAGDFAAAAKQFGQWVNAGGKKMAGLVTRRAAEAKLYES